MADRHIAYAVRVGTPIAVLCGKINSLPSIGRVRIVQNDFSEKVRDTGRLASPCAISFAGYDWRDHSTKRRQTRF